ncbi:hypothetical protein Pmani_018936 [Petrolisthes manimaculis]|uniref:Ionotropic glutamate receptor C-terminal domain-containing protein n=1 Tax=Petrolisthes manimaculis TaxID=1843537 RepID=A0AAE1U891_9EUCA|nr:hypothetical protein Pmani_018936 [Petrolisthes manimaculis]
MKGVLTLQLLSSYIILLLMPVNGRYAFHNRDGETSEVVEAANAVLGAARWQRYFVCLITDTTSNIDRVAEVSAPLGVGVFQVTGNDHDANWIQAHISSVVQQVQLLQSTSQSMTVMLASDDANFLSTFSDLALNGRLLMWSTRILLLTRLPLHRLDHLRNTLAITNSMLLICSLTPNIRLSQAEVLVARVIQSTARTKVVNDPDAPGGKRVIILESDHTLLETVAEAMNFTTPGKKELHNSLPNFLYEKKFDRDLFEVDIALGLFDVTEARAQVVDFTFPVDIMYTRLIFSRGKPAVDPWGFLLPLAPLVWMGLLVALFIVLTVMIVLSYCLPVKDKNNETGHMIKAAKCIRVILQQDVAGVYDYWWWERVLLGTWMLSTLVLTRSYAGNLMSLLAIRYIPMPIQSLQDVIQSTSTIILQEGTNQLQTLQAAETGIYSEVHDLEKVGRLKSYSASEMTTQLDSLVRSGEQVLVMVEVVGKIMMAQDFSSKGVCDFYLAREEFLASIGAMAGPKHSPLIAAINHRILEIRDAGLYDHWVSSYTPNYTTCLNQPTTVAIKSSLGLINVWVCIVKEFLLNQRAKSVPAGSDERPKAEWEEELIGSLTKELVPVKFFDKSESVL